MPDPWFGSWVGWNLASTRVGWTSGIVSVVPSDSSYWSSMMHVSVDTKSSQRIVLSSTPFAVTSGASFALKWRARVATVSTNKAYAGEMMVIFTDATGTEVVGSRTTIQMVPSSTQTTIHANALGEFKLQVPDAPGVSRRLDLIFDDGQRWPAHVEIPL